MIDGSIRKMHFTSKTEITRISNSLFTENTDALSRDEIAQQISSLQTEIIKLQSYH